MNDLKRAARPTGIQSYVFGSFRMDLPSYQLLQDGQPVPLSPKAFDTLLVLVANRDRIVSKDELLSAVWPDSFVSEDSLTQAISHLRRTLGDEPTQPRFIATVARTGYHFIADVEELTEEGSERVSAPTPAPVLSRAVQPAGRWQLRGLTIAAVLVAVAAAIVLGRPVLIGGAAPLRGPLRFTQEAPDGAVLASGAVLSPDGRYLAFVATDERSGSRQLWVRPLDTPEARVLPGTEGAQRPFWSPDSATLAFFAGSRLKRIDLKDGASRLITTVSAASYGGSWNTSGDILFTQLRSGVFVVPAEGGTPRAVTTVESNAQEVAHRWPQFLPDGRHFLFYVDSLETARQGTWLGTLDSPERRRVIEGTSVFAPPGYLLFVRDRVLMAQAFDPASGALAGRPSTLASNVVEPQVTNGTAISASADRLLAFSVSRTAERLEWFDRGGRTLGIVDTPVDLRNPRLTADGLHLFASTDPDSEKRGLWSIDLARGAVSRLTADGMRPFESPDLKTLAYTSDRGGGVANIYERATAGGDADDRLLVRSGENKFICDWSRDGRFIVYGSTNPRTNTDLWVLPRTGNSAPYPLVRTNANELGAQISPDGHWVAYASDESGGWQVYVQPFPQGGEKQAISVGGGVEPHWRGDGKELFFIGGDGQLMAVTVKADRAWAAGAPQPLFRAPLGPPNLYINQYAVAPDGRRFLFNAVQPTSMKEPITVVVNWTALIES